MSHWHAPQQSFPPQPQRYGWPAVDIPIVQWSQQCQIFGYYHMIIVRKCIPTTKEKCTSFACTL